MPLSSLREYIKDKSKDLKNAMREGGMSEKTVADLDIILRRHFRIKVLLAILEEAEPDPHHFWEQYFDLCAYNVFKIGVDIVMKKVLEIPDEQ